LKVSFFTGTLIAASFGLGTAVYASDNSDADQAKQAAQTRSAKSKFARRFHLASNNASALKENAGSAPTILSELHSQLSLAQDDTKTLIATDSSTNNGGSLNSQPGQSSSTAEIQGVSKTKTTPAGSKAADANAAGSMSVPAENGSTASSTPTSSTPTVPGTVSNPTSTAPTVPGTVSTPASAAPTVPVTGSTPASAAAAGGATPPTGAATQAADGTVTLAEPIRLTDETPINHDANKTLDLNPLYLSTAVEMHSFRALRSETNFDQSIKLRDAISYVLDHGLQIKNSRESLIYQHWQTVSQVASALPNFIMSYNLSRSDVYNKATTSIARSFFTGVSFPVFAGGGTVANILAQHYREKAWLNTYKSTFQDVFLTVYQNYTNLLLQRVLLQIWAKAVEADQEQVRINNAQLQNGTGTKFNLLQSETQLAADRQSFLNQEVQMRLAALTLNSTMNYPMEINLIPVEETLTEAPIFTENVTLQELLDDAFRFSPGMRQYEYFKLTANRNIQIASANFYPNVSFFISWQFNDTSVNPPGNGAALGGVATTAIDSALNTSFAGRVSNNALGQQQGFSPTAGQTSTQGINAAPVALPPVSLPPSAGGTPINAVQSGSAVTSGAVAPSIFGGGTGTSSGSNSNGSLQAPSGVFPGLFREIQMGFQFQWTLPNAGLTYAAQIMQARSIARQAMLQCNQELTLVEQNIRQDYLNMKVAKQVIDRAAAAVASSREALRIARVRLEGGVGTNLDVITAQQTYITNLTAQAQAIVASNVAQAQLLHDMGMISGTTLTTGYHHGFYDEPRPTKKIHWLYP
jgi:outer membrane protein TolC